MIRLCGKAMVFVLVLGLPALADDFDAGRSAYEQGDFDTASSLWTSLAEQGDAPSQYALARMYHYGAGVEPDMQRALEW